MHAVAPHLAQVRGQPSGRSGGDTRLRGVEKIVEVGGAEHFVVQPAQGRKLFLAAVSRPLWHHRLAVPVEDAGRVGQGSKTGEAPVEFGDGVGAGQGRRSSGSGRRIERAIQTATNAAASPYHVITY
jgi:hypothetical protein